MGIYIFNTETLLKALIADAEDPDSKHDFGHNILPNMLGKKKMMAYTFVDENKKQALYWRDVGTLDAYYDANMDLCSVSPIFNLYDRNWPMRTRVRQYPPAKFVFGEPGRTGIRGQLRHHRRRHHLRRLGFQFACCRRMSASTRTPMWIRASFSPTSTSAAIAASSRSIIDRDVHIPEGTVIGYDQVEDKRRYFVTPSGLTIVTRDASLFENPVDPDFLQHY